MKEIKEEKRAPMYKGISFEGKEVVGAYLCQGGTHYIITAIRDKTKITYGHRSEDVEVYRVIGDTVYPVSDNNGEKKEIIYSAADVAKLIINSGIKENSPVSNWQLQRILYILQKEWLKNRSRPLFKEEIVAADFGPKIHEVYGRFCGYGSLRIKNGYEDESIRIYDDDKKVIEALVGPLLKKDKPYDMKEAIEPGGAWDKTYKKKKYGEISLDLIKAE